MVDINEFINNYKNDLIKLNPVLVELKPKNINDFIEMAHKCVVNHKFFKFGELIITYLKNIQCINSQQKQMIDLLCIAVSEITTLVACSPDIIYENIEITLFNCKDYNIYSPVCNLYIRFYFWFFENLTVGNASCKIAEKLYEYMKKEEIEQLLSDLSDEQRKCIILSMNELNESKNKLIVNIKVNYHDDVHNLIYYQVYNSDNDNKILSGHSSTEQWMKNDVQRSLRDMCNIDPNYKIYFIKNV